ncbi:MAG: (d)CMP kinase [Candidatus Muiribacteriota bacterium]
MNLSIAIDGPAGSGKSTIAKILSEELKGYYYVDSGSFYRAVTWHILNNKLDLSKEKELQEEINKLNLSAKPEGLSLKVLLNNKDCAHLIRTREVTRNVSEVSAISCVRDKVNSIFKKLAGEYNIIMEGRDIGTVVLKNAGYKFFLMAEPEERATRRLKELAQKGENYSFREILDDIKKRDKYDSNRKIAPLKKASDAVEVDTTFMSINEVVQKIKSYLLKEKK